MAKPDPDKPKPASPREQRLAQALRDNLRRRKAPAQPGAGPGDKDAS